MILFEGNPLKTPISRNMVIFGIPVCFLRNIAELRDIGVSGSLRPVLRCMCGFGVPVCFAGAPSDDKRLSKVPYLCACVCIHIYIFIYLFICFIYIFLIILHIYIYIYIYIYIHTYMYVCISMHVCMHAQGVSQKERRPAAVRGGEGALPPRGLLFLRGQGGVLGFRAQGLGF